MLSPTVLVLAKASALAKMVQLTTMRGRYMPRALYSAGTNLFNNISTKVTKVAMISTKQGIRTLSGMTLRSKDTSAFEHTRTKVAASPIPKPLNALVVTASVGQVPRTSLNTGFDVIMPFVKIFDFDGFIMPPPYFVCMR